MSEENLNTMSFTGERYTPGSIQGGIVVEHWHRYAWIAHFVAGKTILDIASGEGYGTAHLAKYAQHATGVDISDQAIAFAKEKYVRENLTYKVGNCSAIPLADASVDVVVSFETIEHHDEHEAMMAEVKRVLKPNGLFIISSPDKKNYSDIPKFQNEFHVHELYREEFEALLKKHFKNLTMLGQRLFSGSVILNMDEHKEGLVATLEESADIAKPFHWADKTVYEIAFVSDGTLPETNPSIFESAWMQRVHDDEMKTMAGHIQHRENLLTILRAENARLATQGKTLYSSMRGFLKRKFKN
jgi:ubiquinone/menaquinone biosynthesis C-methylase UbiE